MHANVSECRMKIVTALEHFKLSGINRGATQQTVQVQSTSGCKSSTLGPAEHSLQHGPEI